MRNGKNVYFLYKLSKKAKKRTESVQNFEKFSNMINLYDNINIDHKKWIHIITDGKIRYIMCFQWLKYTSHSLSVLSTRVHTHTHTHVRTYTCIHRHRTTILFSPPSNGGGGVVGCYAAAVRKKFCFQLEYNGTQRVLLWRGGGLRVEKPVTWYCTSIAQ